MKGKIDEKSLRKDKILAIINKRLTPRQKQKKDLGEVFTPIELIEDMLSHLPKSDWSNPDLKWLDPANGIGNFPVVIFYKLDEGLKEWEPNENKRRKHIIENMIFMMEIQSNNNRIARNIFTSLCKSCTPNIWTIDTLKSTNEKIKEYFHVENFDRIIGNPPFQAFQEAEGKRGGGDELYMKFVKKSIEKSIRKPI
jgi:type I restriction-modification system DNA methylase subunit